MEGMDKMTFSVPGASDDDGKKGPRLPAVCVVCDEKAEKKCACKLVMYCSKECQKRDWKAGHTRMCVCAARKLDVRKLPDVLLLHLS